MSSITTAAPGYAWVKTAVFALLAWNTAVFWISGTLNEALDATAWLLLLASFELETGFSGRFGEGREVTILRGARLIAAAAILAAATGYVSASEWLDAINTGLWIAVVALLEIEVRYADAVARHRIGFAAAAASLSAGLGMLVLAWLWQDEWFEAYDAALWLVAFATIEMNILQIPHSRAGAGDDAPGPG